MPLRTLVAALVGFMAFTSQSQAPVRPAPLPADAPRLLVIIVIDQFRADYFDMYSARWTQGLRTLLDRGASFTRSAYPYASTFTCAGHATIGTGAFPSRHGMTANEFYDRTLRRLLPCAFDATATSVAFGGGRGTERHSGRSLLVPTFADELRRQSPVTTRVVSIAQKPRSSITMAGRGSPDTIAVFEEDDGTWATSDAYAQTPWPEVDEFVRAHPMSADYGAVWEPLLAPAAYRFVDDGAGEGRPAPWGRTFPHPLISRSGKPDNEFVTAWERSPWDDAFLTDLAIHLLRRRRLGTGPGTDLLTLSLPSLDHVGHEYGPRSHEVQDVLARVDANVGRLLAAIEEQVGSRYLVAFSSDHGVATVPEQVVAEGGDAGRVSASGLRDVVDAAVRRELGVEGTAVASIFAQQIALAPGVLDVLRLKAGAIDGVKTAIARVRGIASVYSIDDLIVVGGGDARLRAAQLSYVPGRSGDFMFTTRANWVVRGATGTTHGSPNAYDQRVPLVLFGQHVRPGNYSGTSSPADIAATFAHVLDIRLPQGQGRALTEAVSR